MHSSKSSNKEEEKGPGLDEISKKIFCKRKDYGRVVELEFMNNSLHDTTDDTADDRERNNEEEPQEEGQGITEEEVVCVEGEEAPTLPDEELSSHQEDQVMQEDRNEVYQCVQTLATAISLSECCPIDCVMMVLTVWRLFHSRTSVVSSPPHPLQVQTKLEQRLCIFETMTDVCRGVYFRIYGSIAGELQVLESISTAFAVNLWFCRLVEASISVLRALPNNHLLLPKICSSYHMFNHQSALGVACNGVGGDSSPGVSTSCSLDICSNEGGGRPIYNPCEGGGSFCGSSEGGGTSSEGSSERGGGSSEGDDGSSKGGDSSSEGGDGSSEGGDGSSEGGGGSSEGGSKEGGGGSSEGGGGGSSEGGDIPEGGSDESDYSNSTDDEDLEGCVEDSPATSRVKRRKSNRRRRICSLPSHTPPPRVSHLSKPVMKTTPECVGPGVPPALADIACVDSKLPGQRLEVDQVKSSTYGSDFHHPGEGKGTEHQDFHGFGGDTSLSDSGEGDSYSVMQTESGVFGPSAVIVNHETFITHSLEGDMRPPVIMAGCVNPFISRYGETPTCSQDPLSFLPLASGTCAGVHVQYQSARFQQPNPRFQHHNARFQQPNARVQQQPSCVRQNARVAVLRPSGIMEVPVSSLGVVRSQHCIMEQHQEVPVKSSSLGNVEFMKEERLKAIADGGTNIKKLCDVLSPSLPSDVVDDIFQRVILLAMFLSNYSPGVLGVWLIDDLYLQMDSGLILVQCDGLCHRMLSSHCSSSWTNTSPPLHCEPSSHWTTSLLRRFLQVVQIKCGLPCGLWLQLVRKMLPPITACVVPKPWACTASGNKLKEE